MKLRKLLRSYKVLLTQYEDDCPAAASAFLLREP
jgi:hypothetical protein